MNPEVDVLVDGIALAFVFVGLFGFAISNNSQWLCLLLILVGAAVKFGYKVLKTWRYDE